MNSIWKVRRLTTDFWFSTKKEAEAFVVGSSPMECIIERVQIGSYMNPVQTVKFIRDNFGPFVPH